MFLSRYNDRPSSLKLDHEIDNGGRKGKIHSLNDFDITVWEDGEVTAQRKHYVTTDPGKHFPNMSVSDGAINFPIEDLVSFILDRISAEELADGLLNDADARAALVYKMAERYASPGFEDVDRREFLNKIQVQIHARSVDKAIERLNDQETAHRSRSDYYRWKDVELGHYTGLFERYREALYELREAGKLDDEGVLNRTKYLTTPERLDAYIKENRDPIAKESVGPQWYESRDYWRLELMKFFPEPEVENDTAEAEAV
jgi:hypothetical protein